MADVEAVKERLVGQLSEWLLEQHPKQQRLSADTAKRKKGTSKSRPMEKEPVETKTAVCVGLILCEKLKKSYPLADTDLDTGGGQVPGLTPTNVRALLGRHQIFKEYAKETGRTTRSSTPKAKALIERIDLDPTFKHLSKEDRGQVVQSMEHYLIERVKAYFTRKKLEIIIDLSKPGPAIIADILAVAKQKGLGGPVAQHLVGAKLARKFPQKNIDNFCYTSADAQLGRDGDFAVESAAFHVTVAPTLAHLRKCGENIDQGRKPYLIVPETEIGKARAYADAEKVNGKVAITSIEQFVGQNVDEMGEFSQSRTKKEFAGVLIEYNRRVAEAETDQSFQLVIPKHVTED